MNLSLGKDIVIGIEPMPGSRRYRQPLGERSWFYLQLPFDFCRTM